MAPLGAAGSERQTIPPATAGTTPAAVAEAAQPDPQVSARARRRRGRRAALCRRLREAAAEREDARSGTSTRPRSPAATSTTTSATRTTSRCATCSKRSSRTRTGVDPQTLAEIQRYTKLFWINTGPVQQPDRAQVRAEVHAGGVRRGGAGRRRKPARRSRSQPARSLDALLDAAAADVLRPDGRSDRHQQDARAGQGHPGRRAPTTSTSASR